MGIDADRFLIHMALYDMSVESSAHEHRALHVDPVADFQQVEVRQTQALLHRRNGVNIYHFTIYHLVICPNNRQAYAVMRDGLIDAERFPERIAEREVFVGLLGLNLNDLSHCFYDS